MYLHARCPTTNMLESDTLISKILHFISLLNSAFLFYVCTTPQARTLHTTIQTWIMQLTAYCISVEYVISCRPWKAHKHATYIEFNVAAIDFIPPLLTVNPCATTASIRGSIAVTFAIPVLIARS